MKKYFSEKLRIDPIEIKDKVYYYGSEDEGDQFGKEQLQEWVNSGWLLSNWNLKINKGESDAFTTLAKKVVEINLPYVEIACGPGLGLTPCIKKQNPSLEVLISDACPYVVEGWKEVIRKNNLTSNISYASFSNTNMPFKDNSIEVITSYVGIGSTRFNGENGMSAINEIYRVLNKGGYLITIENEISDYKIVDDIFSEANRFNYYKQFENYESIVDRLTRAGFTISELTFLGKKKVTEDDNELGELSKEQKKDVYWNVYAIIAKK